MSRVLIVDDQEGIRRTMRGFVAAAGHDVRVAEDIASAVAVLEHEAIDLVLTDYQLEEDDGLALAVAVRARWPWIPVALMSGALDDALEARARAVGVVACLTKPFTLAALGTLIAAVGHPEAAAQAG